MGVYPYSLYQIASISLPDTLKHHSSYFHQRTDWNGERTDRNGERTVSGLLGSFDYLDGIKVGIFQINSIHTRSKIINHVIFSRFRNIKIPKIFLIKNVERKNKISKFLNFILVGRIDVGACEKG